jgi:hypothetical protein
VNKRRRFKAKRRRYWQRYDRITASMIGFSPLHLSRFYSDVDALDEIIVGEFIFPPNARPVLVEMPRQEN